MAFDPSTIADAKTKVLTNTGNRPSSTLTDEPALINIPATWDGFADLAPIGKNPSPAITPTNHWSTDSVTGSTLDADVGTVDGTISNMTQTSGGPFDKYLAGGVISSVQRKIVFPSSVSFKGLSFWIKRDVLTNYGRVFTANTNKYLYINPSTSSNTLVAYDGASEQTSNLAISDTSDFHHIFVAEGASSNSHRFWVDGVKASSALTTNYGGTLDIFGLASTAATQEVCSITNIQVFDFIPTDAQITELYNTNLPLNKKISVTDSSDTQLDVEIEYWNYDSGTPANNVAVLHTLIPTVSSSADTVIELKYDETQDDNTTYIGDTGDTAAQAVWPSNRKARWGMSQDPSGTAPQLLDSTGTYDGTMAGTMLTEDLVDGLVGLGWDFEGTDDSVTTASALGLTAYPIVFFSKFELDNLTTAQPLVSGDDASNYIGLSVWVDTSGAVNIRLGDGTGVTSADHYTWKTANSVIAATTEYILELLVTNFTTVVLYIDGSTETLSFSAGTGASADLSNALYRIGTSAADSTFIDGKIYDMFLGSFALTADEASIQNLSLTDTLWTWSDPATTEIVQFWDQMYGDPANTEHTVWWDQSYALFNYIVQYFDQIYGIQLQKHWDFDYSNSPLVKAFWDLLYGNQKFITKFWDLEYEDRIQVIRYWDQKYNIRRAIQHHWDQKYGIMGKEITQYFDQEYDVKNTNPLMKWFDQYYHIVSDSVVEAAALGFYIDGVKYEGPYHVSWELNVDSYKNTGEMHFNYPDPFFAAGEGVEMRIVDTDIDLYLEVTIPTKSESVNETLYYIKGESKSRILERAGVFTETFSNTTAATICTIIAARHGITIDWQIPDWAIIEFDVNDQTPLAAIKELTETAAKAILQTDFNGDTVSVMKRMESDSHMWDTDAPTYYVNDSLHLEQTSQRGEYKDGYNAYRITDQASSSETKTWLEDDDYADFRREVKVFRVPWDGESRTLYTSDNNATIQYLGVVTEELTEDFSIVDAEGESTTDKPFYSLVSYTPNDTDLGEPTITEEGVVQTPNNGTTMYTITYMTKYYKWIVTDYDDETIQIWVE